MPQPVKSNVLLANSLTSATWVETGTYRGDTTAFLSDHAKRVISLEPEPGLYALAAQRFVDVSNVTLINETSEACFPKLLPTLSGNICFWLDGHFSAGGTFLGENHCPVEHELAAIAANRERFSSVTILVDDLRLFGREEGYPSADFLVDWARLHRFDWSVEHDIFIMRSDGSVSQ